MNIENTVAQAASFQRKAAASGSEGGKSLGKQDFLNLMMTQMSHQDPLNPMESNQMMQQFAALGTVEQLQNLNQGVAELSAKQSDLVHATAYSFLGKDIEIDGNHLNVSDGSAAPVLYQLDGDAEQVTVQILDHQGEIVRTYDQGSQAAGSHQVRWDAKDTDGDEVPDRSYEYRVIAKSTDGNDIQVSQFKQGRVSGISFDNGSPMVKVNGELLPLSSIKSLNNESEKRFGNAELLPLQREIAPKLLKPFEGQPLER